MQKRVLIDHITTILMANKDSHMNKSHKNNVECFLASAHNAYQDSSRPCPIINKILKSMSLANGDHSSFYFPFAQKNNAFERFFH